MTYAKVGPPFNFLGHQNKSQYASFKNWVNQETSGQKDASTFYRMRAQQLRKSAGMLEACYQGSLSPSFQKEVWKPGPDGHFGSPVQDDHRPMVAMSEVKGYLRKKLQVQDEAVFFMNRVRTIIERTEDAAQYALESVEKLPELLTAIDSMYNEPRYSKSLIKDQEEQYEGEPLYRANTLDPPTAWEKALIFRKDWK